MPAKKSPKKSPRKSPKKVVKKLPIKVGGAKKVQPKKSPKKVQPKKSPVKVQPKKSPVNSSSNLIKDEDRFFLRELGYSLKSEDSERHEVLENIVKKYGKDKVIAHLKNIQNLSTFEDNKKKIANDLIFIEKIN